MLLHHRIQPDTKRNTIKNVKPKEQRLERRTGGKNKLEPTPMAKAKKKQQKQITKNIDEKVPAKVHGQQRKIQTMNMQG